MKKIRIFFHYIIYLLLAGIGVDNAYARVSPADSLVTLGDSLRHVYRFDESVAAYTEALESLADTCLTYQDSVLKMSIGDRLLLSENGRNMTGYVYSPNVIARHKFSLDDFFLYYPLKDRSWRLAPNQLDSLSGKYAKAVYAPAEDKVIYFSAPDSDGIRNIYRTYLADTIWTVPALLNEHMTSVYDEIYPMLSPDGESLYFASQGLYGVGGYDLYMSQWDESEGDWSVPVNMGFPYSSPANDFLLVNSEDGKYTLFASDRECSGDSVWVYVLEYDNMPVRSSMSDPLELLTLSRLEPVSGLDISGAPPEVKSEISENVDTRRYMDKMAQIRALRDSISFCETSLADCREKYSILEDNNEKQRLAEEILWNESQIPAYQKRLDEAIRQLQEVEMDFLFSGVVIDPDNLLAEAEREIVSETPDYVFSKMNIGEPLTLEMQRPEPEFDYSFKVLEEGQFALDNTIPHGIIYQIQLFTANHPAAVSALNGLSPVFETRSPSGRYIYRVGLFNTYKDVLSRLNTVKKLGFKTAFIVAYVDGKEMQVGKVRNLEHERKQSTAELYNVMVIPSGGELDSVAIDGIRQQAAGKDVARTEGGFIIGPFDNKTVATALVEFIEVMGYGDVKLETIQK